MSDIYEKKRLRIVEKGFETYTGELSVYMFENGVSVETIPRVERDRIAATMACVEVDEGGREKGAGVAERLVSESKARAPEPEQTERQSEDEKSKEEREVAAKATISTVTFYSEDELDAVIAEGGIHALREVAKQWNLKGRSIPQLRDDVLNAQKTFLENNQEIREQRMKMIEAGQTNPEPEPGADTNTGTDQDAVQSAAETGDMSAALNKDRD
jgi:hypothetical protein